MNSRFPDRLQMQGQIGLWTPWGVQAAARDKDTSEELHLRQGRLQPGRWMQAATAKSFAPRPERRPQS